jgi:transcriptional regulator with XRE-family HTH domain
MTDPEDDDYLQLGRALAAIRRRAGRTQAEAGAAIGVGDRHISTVEKGTAGIAFPTLMKLLRFYESNLAELAVEVERPARYSGARMTSAADDYSALGRALAALRHKAGKTQAEAGAAVKVSGRHISTAEHGAGIAYPTMMALLRFYRATLADLAAEIERGEAR